MSSKKQVALSLPEQLDKWVLFGLLAIAVAVPLALSRFTFDQFDIAKIITLRFLTLGALGFWAWKTLASKDRELRWSKIDFVLLGFLSLVLLSTITSIHLPTAIHGKFKRYEGLLTFINYGLVYFLALQTFTGFKRLSLLSKTITIVGGIIGFYGIMQYVGIDPFKWAALPFEERRSFSTFGNPDLLAGYLVLVAPIAAAEFLRAKTTGGRIWTFASLGFILSSLLWTFTRGAWIAVVVAFIVFAVVAVRSIRANLRTSLIAAGVAIVILAATAFLPQILTGHKTLNLIERVQSIANITDGSAGTRLEIWTAGLKMIHDRPILGFGPDTFRLTSEKYETLRYTQMGQGLTVADNAHNYVIQLAAGLGVPGALAFIALVIALVVIALRYARRLQGDDLLVYAGFVAAIVGYFVHLLFGLSVSGSTSVFWLLLGAVLAVTPAVRIARLSQRGVGKYALQGAMLVAALVALVSAYYAGAMYIADNNYAGAIQAANAGDYTAADERYKRALDLYKNGRYYDGYGMFLERVASGGRDRGYINQAEIVYNEATQWEPNEADHYTFLASAKAKLSVGPDDPILDESVADLKQAIRVRPKGLSAHELLGNIYIFQGKYKDAIAPLKFALLINPQDASANQMIAQAYAKLGNKAEAKRYYETVLAADPNNQTAKDGLKQLASSN